MAQHQLGILFSGGGTTAEAMVKAIQTNTFPNIHIACAISSNPDAGGIAKLTRLTVPVFVVDPKEYKTPDGKRDSNSFGQAILDILTKHGVTVVTQNGWIPLTPEIVISQYEGNIYNQHPGPLPEFGGKGMMGKVVHDAFLRFRKKIRRPINTYVISHRVTTGLDEGAVVRRMLVKVLETDTPETLQERALPLEHETQIALLYDINNDVVTELIPMPVLIKGEEELLVQAKQEAIIANSK